MELYEIARKKMTICKGCPVCNGLACRGLTPGCGGKGSGEGFVRNYQSFRNIGLVMDCIHEDYKVDTSCTLFGVKMSAPIFVAPIGNIPPHMGCEYDDYSYTNDITIGMRNAGMVPFFGDGAKKETFKAPMKALEESGGYGIMTIKPWSKEFLDQKLEETLSHSPIAIAMDVDASGLIHAQNTGFPIEFKSVDDLKEIRSKFEIPFIVKGIMSVDGARKALDAGASGIVISNHGGRVLDECISPMDVLEEISEFVKGRMTILIDGGIRYGNDIFKALALGADGVLIGRPFLIAAIADGANGVETLAEKYKKELEEAMYMCNCKDLEEITKKNVRIFQK